MNPYYKDQDQCNCDHDVNAPIATPHVLAPAMQQKRNQNSAGSGHPTGTEGLSYPTTHRSCLLGRQVSALDPDPFLTRSNGRNYTERRIELAGSLPLPIECVQNPMFDIPMLVAGLEQTTSTTNHHIDGPRSLSSWLARLPQQATDAHEPLYTDDELQRLHYLMEELRRLDIQRRARLSLQFLNRYQLAREEGHRILVGQSQQTSMPLDERLNQRRQCGPERSFRSDIVHLKNQNFTLPAIPTHANGTSPFPDSKVIRTLMPDHDGEDLSSDSSAAEQSGATSSESSLEDIQDNIQRKKEEDAPHHEAPQDSDSASGIIPRLIQQYKSAARGLAMAPFPLKLHAVLANPRYHHVICWLPDGKSWRVLDAFLLERFVIPRHFGHNKYSSFMRQVNGWGFARRSCRHGPDKGKSYSHVDFVRDDPERCLSMLRRRRAKKVHPSL